MVDRYLKPSGMLIRNVNYLLLRRKLLGRHLRLPRQDLSRKKQIPTGMDLGTGWYNALEYLSFLWYVKPTFVGKWDTHH